MNKNICITVIGFLIIFKIQAQDIFDKKGMWGFSYGANIFYPTENTFTFGYFNDDNYKRYVVWQHRPKLTIGHFFEISKNYQIKNINNSSKLCLVPSVGFYQTKYYTNYEMFANYGYHKGKIDIDYFSIVIGLKIKLNVFFENNNVFLTYFNIDYYQDVQQGIGFKHINANFGLGYGFNINNLYLAPYIEHEIITKSNYLFSYSLPQMRKMYNNMQIGVLFNF